MVVDSKYDAGGGGCGMAIKFDSGIMFGVGIKLARHHL
jgi:hypothetical protein